LKELEEWAKKARSQKPQTIKEDLTQVVIKKLLEGLLEDLEELRKELYNVLDKKIQEMMEKISSLST